MGIRFLYIGVALASVVLLGGCGADSAKAPETPTQNVASPYDDYEGYLLEGYPEAEVPLFESLAIDSCFYTVRNDPQWQAVEGGLRNFYNVVYLTNKTDKEVINYYRGLMSDINTDVTNDTTIEGMIGPYKVWVNTTVDDETDVYLSVDIPSKDVKKVNPFFTDYPEGVASLAPKFKQFEHKYQVASNGDGELRYEEYYETPVSAKKFDKYCKATFGKKDDFAADGDGMYRWIEGEYRVTMVYAKDHKRTYVSIAKNLPKK